jgi:prepilin-type N-terminal cleavage/methylation domain-containing protein
MMRERRRDQGFTMAELLVAMVVLAIVTTGAMLVFTAQHQTYIGQERVLEAQQDARLVTEMMLADIRLGGFLVPTNTGIGGIDGGNSAPDVICTSDPSVIDEAEIDQSNGRFPGARLQSTLGADAEVVTLNVASMDIDNSGDSDFAVGSGILISDGADTHCARVTVINAGAVTFTPRTPAGFSVGTGATRAVPAVIYELNGTTLRRNSALLSQRIENLQIEYAIDLDDNGTIDGGEFPVDDMTASDPDLIRGARVSVIARTASEDPDFRSGGMPAAGNHDAGAPDGFMRRRFSANVIARNL